MSRNIPIIINKLTGKRSGFEEVKDTDLSAKRFGKYVRKSPVSADDSETKLCSINFWHKAGMLDCEAECDINTYR